MSRTAAFVVDLPASCPPDEALRRVLDLRAHSRLIPLTTVTPAVAPDGLATGLTFVGRTAVGRVGFDDPMRILSLSFDPPAARIVKEGRIIAGAINITVTPAATGSRVRWEQTVEIPWLPRSLQPVAARILREGYRRMLSKLLDGG